VTAFVKDSSDYDPDFSVSALAIAGMRGLTNKATEGTTNRHSTFGPRIRAAAADPLYCMYGGYVVPRTPGNGGNGSVQAQVDYYLSYLDSQTPGWRSWPYMVHQVDTEIWSYDWVLKRTAGRKMQIVSGTQLTALHAALEFEPTVAANIGLQMAQLLAQETGQRVVIYASYGQYGTQLWGKGFPLWNASYHNNPQEGFQAAYEAAGGDSSADWHGGAYTLTQFGSRVSVGLPASIGDCSAFRGSDQDLSTWAGARMDIDYAPNGNPTNPAGPSNRSAKIMIADLWGQEFEIGGPYDPGSPTKRAQRLMDITATLTRIEAALAAQHITATLSDDQLAALGQVVGKAVVDHHDALSDDDLAAVATAVQAGFRQLVTGSAGS
jgi:hypothetical protein